jgi:hypothetical protein
MMAERRKAALPHMSMQVCGVVPQQINFGRAYLGMVTRSKAKTMVGLGSGDGLQINKQLRVCQRKHSFHFFRIAEFLFFLERGLDPHVT